MGYERQTDFGTPESKSTEAVTLTIDGREVTVPAGTSVMRAAAEIGGDIPKLCATDNIKAFGSCRLCLVEIDGARGTPAICTTPVGEGMVVHTQTPRLEKLRKGVMELYISDHPLDCLTCSANNDCELQDQAAAVGLRDVRYGYEGDNHLALATDHSNPYFDFDPSQVHRLLALRARLRRGAGHFRADDRRARLRLEGFRRAGRRRFPLAANASAAAPACRPARPRRCRKRASRRSASPNARSSPPAPIAASAAPSAPKCAANSWCAWCRGRTARPTAGTAASRAASPMVMPTTRTASPRR